MSSKIKKKTEKIKKKVIKRATIKQAYTEKELVDIKSKYRDIISHLSLFLSEHNVYEAVPENAKLLVFNSELSFYEMIKIFIFEDIYCGLIYDQKINNYIGLITTRDIMILHKYIIDNFPPEKIADFRNYLKTIFSDQKIDQIDHFIEHNSKKDISIINNDINIFKHLTDVSYVDYLKYAKKKQFKNINMHSALLDDNLLETIMKLNVKHFDRLLVEEERKNGRLTEKSIPESQKNEKMEQSKKVESSETVKTKTRNSRSEKTTTANDSDEENKTNQNQNKKDIKKIIEQNEENIAEEPTNNIKLIKEEEDIKDKPKKIIKKTIQKNKEVKAFSEGKNNNNIKEGEKSTDKPKKKIIKKIIKKKKNFADENKTDDSNINDNTNDNIIENDTSQDESKRKVKKIVKKKEVKREETLETININALESGKKESLPKRKKIIKRKKKKDESSVLSDQSHTLKESRTDDELAPKTKRIFKKKVKQERRTTFDAPMSKNDDSIKCEKEIIYRDGKKIIRKKIIKKKIIKKKIKKVTNENNIKTYDQNKSTTNEENTIEISDETNNIKSTTGGGDDTQSLADKEKEKEKYELPKIKMRKITAKRNKSKEEKEKEKENEKENKNDINERKEDKKYEDNKDKNQNHKKDINENKENSDKEKENNHHSKDIEIKDNKNENKKEEESNEIKANKDENDVDDKETINIDKEKLKKEEEEDEIVENNTLSNAYSKEIKNYLGVVNNDTIFEYLIVNYYSNDMKEFNLSLNELLLLGDTPFIQRLDKGEDMNQKVYNTFNKYLFNNSDIIPINNGKEIVGFIYPKDFFYYLYNCESKQSLTNNDFLINLYKDVDEEKPYGKNRVIYMELNIKNKQFFIKELLEKLNCSIEKKIVLYEPNDNSKLYLISLKTIFKAIVEFQSKNK